LYRDGNVTAAGSAALRHRRGQHGATLRNQQRGLEAPRFFAGGDQRPKAGVSHALPARIGPRASAPRTRVPGRGLCAGARDPGFPRQNQTRHHPLVDRLARVGMVAGEASGDLLAAHLIAALKARRRAILFSGIGGPKMLAQGFQSHYPMEKLSVRGYAEVLKHYREIMGIRRSLRNTLLTERPDLFIGVDSSDFNLGLEGRLKQAGIPAIHYVSPSVWVTQRAQLKLPAGK